MGKIWAIAVIAFRNAIRSRVVGVMILMLTATIIALPLTIVGDKTVFGYFNLSIRYTLSFITFILAISTFWAGCAAVSMEIQEKQLHLVVTKPVHSLQVWLGKWLGLLLINAILLTFSGVVIYSLMKWNLRPSQVEPEDQRMLQEELMIARNLIPFRVKNRDAEIERAARARMEEGGLPKNTPFSEVLKSAREQLTRHLNTVSVGQTRKWIFDLPEKINQEPPLLVRFRFSSSMIGSDPILGTFKLSTANQPDLHSVTSSNAPNHMHTFTLPVNITEGTKELHLEYSNHNATPVSIIFDPDDGMQLLAYSTTFESNLVRALFMIFLQLAFFGAIGLTAGSMFSMPVAALVSIYVILLFSSSGYIEQNVEGDEIVSYEKGQAPDWFLKFLKILFSLLHTVVKPLQTENFTELLALGRLIPGAIIFHTLLFKILVYSGLMALFGAWTIRKREIALPTQ